MPECCLRTLRKEHSSCPEPLARPRHTASPSHGGKGSIWCYVSYRVLPALPKRLKKAPKLGLWQSLRWQMLWKMWLRCQEAL